MNAIEALNEYKTKAWRVDDALFQLVTAEIGHLNEMLTGNSGMSVMDIRAQLVDLHRQLLASQHENKRLREALQRLLGGV